MILLLNQPIQKQINANMNKFIILISFVLSSSTFAQSKSNIIEETFDKMKSNTKVDKTDFTCYDLVQKMYDEVLQNNNSDFKESTIEDIRKYQSNRKSKNTYLFSALMFYQDVITKSAEQKMSKPELQRDIINYLEKEFLEVYNKIPAIIYVYKVETLNLLEDKNELKKYIDEGLKNYPNSIPLKYYSYKYLNDITYKEELMRINNIHWLVNIQE
jgi:hypothetical protein